MTNDGLPEYDDLTEKDLLILILFELRDLNHRLQPPEPDTEPVYECLTCHSEVPESERMQHLIDHHNAPGTIDASGEYTEL